MYKEVAPRVQQELDDIVQQTIDAGKKARLMACEHKLGKHVGEDIPGKIEKATSMQNACLQMQEIANRIAVKDANMGFPKTAGSRCTMNDRVSEPGECDYLNCYTTDDKFKKAIAALKKRNDKCYDAWRPPWIARPTPVPRSQRSHRCSSCLLGWRHRQRPNRRFRRQLHLLLRQLRQLRLLRQLCASCASCASGAQHEGRFHSCGLCYHGRLSSRKSKSC
ncbi:unnamed protein product [Cladocopium goreaui]|uniref:Uncharacterized protein n=1 Tax=Cladocopium goreaui TaxID=2562237 RepID=A0A9P1CKA2_9DINO|nr:unnamed protein product [Cladocopium goreaui]